MTERLEGIDDVRAHTARGTIINAAFQISLAALSFARRFLIAAFLTASEFAVWGIVLASLFLVVFVKSVGTVDKFVQQDDSDQELAFQKAFTIDLLLGGLATLLAAGALPLIALAYGQPEIILPGLVLSMVILTSSLTAPTWIFSRRMDFVRQRLLLAVEPIVAFVVTIAMAIAGFGYWSLVAGAVAGSLCGGVVAIAVSPYRLAFRFDRATARDYFGFSWPLVVASGGGILVAQVILLVAARTLGMADVGAIGLAVSITAFTGGVDRIVTQTLYPAICAVRDRMDVMYEAFVKSNRLALMWGVPFGVGVALFAQDLADFVFGASWQDAVVLLQAFGLAAAIDQVGFNWGAFLRALDRTRPLAVLAVLHVVASLSITIPLLVVAGLDGLAVGVVTSQFVLLGARAHYLRKLFAGFSIVRQMVRGVAPVVPAVILVLAARAADGGDRTLPLAIGELVVFLLATVAGTLVLERDLLREVAGYLRRRAAPQIATG